MSECEGLTQNEKRGDNMKRAAFICFFNAMITIPLNVIGIKLGMLEERNFTHQIIDVSTNAISLILTVYILLLLKRLLKEKCHFVKVDSLLSLAISVQVVVGIIGAICTFIPEYMTFGSILILVAMVVTGILYTIIGAKLFKMENNLYGFLKPFCILFILMGVGSIIFVFLPIVLLSSITADILLGVVFLKEVEKAAASSLPIEGVEYYHGKNHNSRYPFSRKLSCR